jgi:hypothetical protein
MVIRNEINDSTDDDVSAAFDDEPTELCSHSVAGAERRTRIPRQNITAHHYKARQDHRPHTPSFLVDCVFQALRFFSGVTISTTSAILRPPLRMTQSLVLPEIGYSLSQYYNDITPERMKLWLQVLPSFLIQTVQVLSQTDRGVALGTKLSSTASIGIETLSTEEMMQVLLSSVALWIKVAHALQTPEVHEALAHNADLACQWLDALSSSGMKRLITEIRELVWTAIQLAADHQTTAAFANVTATLCHALESGQLDDIGMDQLEELTNKNQGNTADSGGWIPMKDGPTTTCSESDVSFSEAVPSAAPFETDQQKPSLPTSISTKSNLGEDEAAQLDGKSNDPLDRSATAAMQLFMRMFEETINAKRSETISSILKKKSDGSTTLELKDYKEKSQRINCGGGDKDGEEVLNSYYTQYYTQWWLSLGERAIPPTLPTHNDRRRQSYPQDAMKLNLARDRLSAILGCLILITILFFGVLFTFGIYGIYKAVFSGHAQHAAQPEVVVRVIREVIHLSADGHVLDRQLLGEYHESHEQKTSDPINIQIEGGSSDNKLKYCNSM